ncbi:MAG: PHP domain-containing protein [Clostridiales bacterium]|nr:PHP domain-containing protein [Clostridiales bacterium]
MKRTVDLHTHSSVSDGTLSPSELVMYAYNHHLSAIALTDHDTVKGIMEAEKAACAIRADGGDFRLIPGVELSLGFRKKDIHMLGLFIDPESEPLKKALFEAEQERNDRNRKMTERLSQAGIDITYEKLVEFCGDAIITRAHFGKYMIAHNIVGTMKEAFTKYLNEDGPYYVGRTYLSPEEGIDLILKAGGVPVLAHPLLYHLSDEDLDVLVHRLSSHGLKGIEAIYSNNLGNDEEKVRALAKKYHLKISGGSDFHGQNKPLIEIGTGKHNLSIPYSILEDLESTLEQ